MGRWMKIAAIFAVTLAFIGVGVGVGLFLIENNRWEPIEVHSWLVMLLPDDKPREVWMPVLIAGWLVAILVLGVLFLWSVFYVWRRRQYESEIRRLQRELIKLRNLPFDDPAPFEDDTEAPDPDAARLMLELREGRGAPALVAGVRSRAEGA